MSGSDSDGDYYGPALPPSFKKSEELEQASSIEVRGSVIGPTLPPHLRAALAEATDKEQENKKNHIGPELPPHLAARTGSSTEPHSSHNFQNKDDDSSGSDSDDMIGPLPPDHPKALATAARFDKSRERKETKPEKKLKREEWMLIPPSNKPVTELELGPRKFQTRAPEQPVMEGKDIVDSDEEFERQTVAAMDQQIIDEYDNKMEAMKSKAEGSKRAGSLLEIHQEEMKKKKTESTEPKERRPFDRDTDLSVTGLSNADKKKFIEKTRELGTRFHKGRQKYL